MYIVVTCIYLNTKKSKINFLLVHDLYFNLKLTPPSYLIIKKVEMFIALSLYLKTYFQLSHPRVVE